jgi:hypothetical protein
MPGRAARSACPSPARAVALPHEALSAADTTFSEAPGTLPDRLAWPVAAAAILATCAGLWLGVGAVLRLVLA